MKNTTEEKKREEKVTVNDLPIKPVEIKPIEGTTSYREFAKMDNGEKPRKEKA